MKLFLTDYASYNEGTQFQFGHWVDLTQFSDASEFFEYISNHFEECDKKSPLADGCPREEIMFTDFEGFPKSLYSETMGEDEVQKIFAYGEIFGDLYSLSNEDWIELHNEYCEDINDMDSQIYNNDEEFLELFSSRSEAVRAAIFGDYNYHHQYVTFNGYGNMETCNDPLSEWIDQDAIIEWKLENL